MERPKRGQQVPTLRLLINCTGYAGSGVNGWRLLRGFIYLPIFLNLTLIPNSRNYI